MSKFFRSFRPSMQTGLVCVLALISGFSVLIAHGQVPTVGFTYQVGEGGLGSTPGANDYNGTAGHMAANTRGDIFVDVAACKGTNCATINNTYLMEIPSGTIATPSSQVALVTGMTTGTGGHSAYVDSSSNVWVADTGDAQIIFIPFVNGAYPASIAHSAMVSCSAFPVPSTTTTACIVPLNYPTSFGNYVQAIDVALDGTGNLYLISRYVSGVPSAPTTQVNKIIEFNTSNVATVVVDNLTNASSAEFAVDKLGNIYYEDGTNVSYYAAGTSTAVAMGTGYSAPTGISIDTGGNVYLADSGNKRMVEFPNINGSITLSNQFTLASNYNCNGNGGPTEGPGIDGFGNLFYASGYPNGICVTRVGYYNVGTINQYYVNPAGSELDMNFHAAATLGSFALAGVGAANFAINSTSASNDPSTCTAGSYAAGSMCKLYVNWAEVAVTGPQSAVVEALDGSGNLLGTGNMIAYGSQAALNVDPGTVVTLGSGWSAPSAVATDGATKLYIADAGSGNIYRSVSAGTPAVVASGLSAPSAIAVDSFENLYVADTGEVVEYPYINGAYGSKVQLVSGLNGPSGLALTTYGYLYVADSGNGRVLQLSQLNRVGTQPLSSVVGNVPGSFSIPVAVAVDNLGSLFVSDAGTKSLYKITLTTTAQTTLLSGLTTPAGVAVDEGGSVYLADSGAETITRIPVIAGVLTPASKVTLTSPVISPGGLACDKAGNLYATDPSNMAVAESNRNGGTLNFGNVVAGSTSSPLTAVLTNTGASGTTLSFYYQGPLTGSGTNNFTENTASSCYNGGNTTSLTLAQGSSCNFTATYAPPTAVGSQSWGVGFSTSGASTGSSIPNFNGATGQSVNVTGTAVSATGVTVTGSASAVYGATTIYTVTNGSTTGGPYTVSITGTATASTTVTLSNGTGTFTLPALGVGSYTLSVTIASATGTESITVTPASLTATAASFSRLFDVANPAFTCSYSGFGNGDTSSVVSGSCGVSTLATRVSPVAIYQLVTSAGSATAANYTVNRFVNGTLTVTGSVPQTIFFPPLPSFTHGSTTYTLTGVSTSGLPLTYAVTSGSATISGSTLTVTAAGAVTITASQPGNATYAAATPVARSFTAQ